MKKINLLKEITTGLITTSLIILTSEFSYSQRPTNQRGPRSLISKENCKLIDGGNYAVDRTNNSVSVGRQFWNYLARLYVDDGGVGGISCRIVRSGNYNPSTLRLGFGISDGSNKYQRGQLQAEIFLNGQSQGSVPIVRGQLHTMALDVKNVSNVGIEVSSRSSFQYSVYIVDAAMLAGTPEENGLYATPFNSELENGQNTNNNRPISHASPLSTAETLQETSNTLKETINTVESIFQIFK